MYLFQTKLGMCTVSPFLLSLKIHPSLKVQSTAINKQLLDSYIELQKRLLGMTLYREKSLRKSFGTLMEDSSKTHRTGKI